MVTACAVDCPSFVPLPADRLSGPDARDRRCSGDVHRAALARAQDVAQAVGRRTVRVAVGDRRGPELQPDPVRFRAGSLRVAVFAVAGPGRGYGLPDDDRHGRNGRLAGTAFGGRLRRHRLVSSRGGGLCGDAPSRTPHAGHFAVHVRRHDGAGNRSGAQRQPREAAWPLGTRLAGAAACGADRRHSPDFAAGRGGSRSSPHT